MRVIPVIDLKGGVVVHGVAGDRARYHPIRSVLASDARPVTVARAFRRAFAFDEVYVADLDAIAGGSPDWDALRQVADSGLKIWLDAGINSVARLRQLMAIDGTSVAMAGVILGLESIPDEATLRACIELLGPAKCVFSLDLRNGQPITPHAAWRTHSALKIATTVIEAGVRRMIVLDLAAVGTRRGPQSLDLFRCLHVSQPSLELIGGGGIRNRHDIQTLADAGCSAVLIATALHDGVIRPSDLAPPAMSESP